jgi:two-component sensor histidine kinase
MTCEAAAREELHSAFDLFKDRLEMARTMFAVQAWRCAFPQQRDDLSDLARRISGVIEQYEQRRIAGVRCIDAVDELTELRGRLTAAAERDRRHIHIALASDAASLSTEGALVLGLVARELVVRALERAEASGSRTVTVRFEQAASGHYLSVADVRPRGRLSVPATRRSYGLDLVRHVVRDLGGALVIANHGAAVRVCLLLGGHEFTAPLRNVSPPRRARDAHAGRGKEERHEFRYS